MWGRKGDDNKCFFLNKEAIERSQEVRIYKISYCCLVRATQHHFLLVGHPFCQEVIMEDQGIRRGEKNEYMVVVVQLESAPRR